MENLMARMDKDKSEAYSKVKEITEVQSQLWKANMEQWHTEDRIEMLIADKDKNKSKSRKLRDDINATIHDDE